MKNIPNWALSLGAGLLTVFVLQMARQAARSADTTVFEKIATRMCSESTATIRQVRNDPDAIKELTIRHSQAAFETFSDPMIPLKQMSRLKDAEDVGMQIYRDMKLKCAHKADILFHM